jgi:hypothetical protein
MPCHNARAYKLENKMKRGKWQGASSRLRHCLLTLYGRPLSPTAAAPPCPARMCVYVCGSPLFLSSHPLALTLSLALSLTPSFFPRQPLRASLDQPQGLKPLTQTTTARYAGLPHVCVPAALGHDYVPVGLSACVLFLLLYVPVGLSACVLWPIRMCLAVVTMRL